MDDVTVLLAHTPMDPAKLTPARAHAVMQLHINCIMEACGRKRQAKAYLIKERRMIESVRHNHDLPGLRDVR